MSLKATLERLGISQAQLCQLTGMDKAVISKLTAGGIEKASVETIHKICLALDCSPLDILSGLFWKDHQLAKEARLIAEYTWSEMPLFSREEKLYIADMMNGNLYDAGQPPTEFLVHLCMDSDLYDGKGDYFGIDVKGLARKLSALTAGQSYCLIQTVREWWADDDRPETW